MRAAVTLQAPGTTLTRSLARWAAAISGAVGSPKVGGAAVGDERQGAALTEEPEETGERGGVGGLELEQTAVVGDLDQVEHHAGVALVVADNVVDVFEDVEGAEGEVFQVANGDGDDLEDAGVEGGGFAEGVDLPGDVHAEDVAFGAAAGGGVGEGTEEHGERAGRGVVEVRMGVRCA